MLKAQIRKRLGELSLSIDLSVEKGITVLRGESGSGKTTIANLLSGALSLQHCARHQPCAGSPRHRIRFSNGPSSAAPLGRRKYSFSSDGRQTQTAS